MQTAQATAPALTIALSTTVARLARIELDRLPADPRWRYVVICQPADGETTQIEAWSKAARAARPDLAVIALAGRGVARSRNAAMEACETETLLFTDDDVRLIPAGLDWLLAGFAADPGLAVLVGQTLDETGAPIKPYPSRAHPLTRFNSARVGTTELAVRPRLLRDRQVQFDPAFGAGANYQLGDEYILIADCLKAGLRGAYGPVPIAVHHGPSSGLDFSTTAPDRARVFERVFAPPLLLAVKLGFLARHWHRLGSLADAASFAREFLVSHKS